jgi:CBS domain-containing protein/gamma-glutamylcysteine synthetase
MGGFKVIRNDSKAGVREFLHYLFKDIEALEIMIDEGMIEEDKIRVGSEQELCLIDKFFRPAPIADEILEEISDEKFTNELAKFNLEINLLPLEFEGNCLSEMEKRLLAHLKTLEKLLRNYDAHYILTGICPTIRSSDVTLDFMTPRERYFALNDAIMAQRGGPSSFCLQGLDELITSSESVMFESCNTSFQVHYQLGSKDFVDMYNWAQAISAPVLSACTNSPIFLGKRLWRESRIALFQQSVDTRNNPVEMREKMPRVYFGDRWVKENIMEIFKEDVASHRPLVCLDHYEDSLEILNRGEIPKLWALQLHNGTIYKWNRVCYGISEGRPHLRIENRYLPSGPTVKDQISNATFWLGLMNGMPEDYRGKWEGLDFDVIKGNFMNAAKTGLASRINWLDGKRYISEDLISQELIPIAREGLKKSNLDQGDIDIYLGIIEERVNTGKTGSQWILDSFSSMKKAGSLDATMIALTAGMVSRQKSNEPIHEWKLASLQEAGGGKNRFQRIDQIMSRNLYTVNMDDPIDLVPNIMMWKQIRHLLVENDEGELVGVVTLGRLTKHFSMPKKKGNAMPAVKTIMAKNIITIQNDDNMREGIKLMITHKIGSLPVLNKHGKLVGIITERDCLRIAEFYLEELEEKQ